jgi:hypothetical protein
MPPRYSYWTILAGGLPTAFRAAERDDLLPTFNRIREKHPDAELKWFARGRLWQSPDEAQADLQRARIRRDREWRPGGDHRDPRQAFKPKRARDNARRENGRRDPSRREPALGERGPGEHPRRDKAPRDQRSRDHVRREPSSREQTRREHTSHRPPSKSAPRDRRNARPPKPRSR